MGEWFKPAVLKTVELKGSGGSNPSLSANRKSKNSKNSQNQGFASFFVFRKHSKTSIKSNLNGTNSVTRTVEKSGFV